MVRTVAASAHRALNGGAPQARSRARLRVLLAVAVWVSVVGVAAGVGQLLLRADVRIVLPTPPVLGEPVGASIAGLAMAAAVGLAIAMYLPVAVQRATWRGALVATTVCALAWWVSLALAEGWSGLVRGPSWSTEYLHDVPQVRADPSAFLRGFTEDIGQYEIHVRGHPPGTVMLLAGLDAVGLGGPRWQAAFVLAIAATAPLAVLLAVRDVAGESTARLAAPFVALAPAAIWIATSADAVYMALAAWAVALVVLATGRTGRVALLLSAGAGVVGAAALLGSYGMVLAGVVPLAVVVRRRRAAAALVAATVAIGCVVALVPFGFWWVDGLAATRHEYETLDLERPYWAFFVINLGAWALALGPATAAGLATLRDRRLWMLVGGGLAAASIANLSGLSEGEVERIWLPFGIWVLPAGAALATRMARARMWLAVQVVSAIVVVSQVRTQW
jgi:methylthioxylose transferase